MSNYVDVFLEDLKPLGRERLDYIILETREILNSSDNFDFQWSIVEIVENLYDGHFDIVLSSENELMIFGALITELDEKEATMLKSLQ